nr:ribonuclease H-like domain-containing protein [Tanacetum cinerariifolium]
MNEFCTKKGIRREFSNARTPQQNGVAKIRNRTLIEAAKTMLADAKLPVTFWAEAINIACYVQNRVLVNKSQNKTPYELFNSRTPAIGFLRPFGCHVMILYTLEQLGKFDVKGDEGYFVGYSLSSKAFRVFNKRTKKVEENLQVDFLENKLIEKGASPNWLFNIDTLTNSMNYVPVVVVGTSSTNISGTKDVVSQAVKKDVSFLRYIDLPNWFHDAHMETRNSDGCNADDPESSGIANPTATSKVPSTEQVEPAVSLIVETEIPNVSSHVPTVCLDISPENASDLRHISKGDFSQKETPSLGNALTLSNRFKDTFGEEADLSNMKTSIPEEPKKIFDALKDPSWVEAMQEELLQFKIQNVWILVDCPKGMDVKSAFLYGTIDEEVYVMQPPVFQDPEFPDRLYKVEKAMGTIDQTLFIRKNKGEFLLVQVHQVSPKECHLYAVKRIFRYLKGHLKLGLWCPKEYPFNLVAYSDSDYGGGTQDRKSTTGGCQFLGRSLISWQCKKHTIVATSTNEAEYVAAASGCGQVLWIQNQMLDYGKFLMAKLALRDSHNMVTILEKTEHNTNFHQIVDFLEAFHIRIEKTNQETKILATVDGKPRTIFDTSLRSLLKLSDEAGISSLPDAELFQNLSLMGYNILPNQSNIATTVVCLATNRVYNFSKMIFDGMVRNINNEPASLSRDDRQGEDFPTVSSLDAKQDRKNINKTSALPHESSPKVTSLDADAGSMQQRLHKLMELCTSLQRQQSQMAAKTKYQDLEISGLKARVKSLEDKERRSAEPTQEDDPIIGGIMKIGEELGVKKSIELGSNDTVEMVNVLSSMEAANILTSGVTTASVSPVACVSTVGVPAVSGSFPNVSVIFTTASVVTPYTRRPRRITIRSSQHIRSPIIRAKDKGKQKLIESEVSKKRKLKEQIDAKVAKEMEEEFARGNQRSNEVIAKHLQEYEQAAAYFSIGEKLELINELVKYQDHRAKILKYQAQQSKPHSKKEQREFYMSVLRSHAGWKTKHLRGMTLEQIKEKLIPVWKQLKDFVPMSSKEEGERVKRQGLKIDQRSSKRMKTSEDVSEEDLKGMMQLVPLEEVYVEALQVKHPIIDWEIHSEGKGEYWKIIRLGGYTVVYQFFVDMLKQFDREDLHQLWTLVKETLSIKQVIKDKEKELWVELKRLFEPNFEDQLWTHNQAFMHDPLDWKLYDIWVRPIGAKWVLKNKKDERGIVIRNKAKLVAQGYIQEEGIDYEEVFAPVARIEAIRLFLAYASFMGFIVYQMYVKSAFLYGTIDEEVYVMQPPRFQDPEFPDRVYKVEKAMYGLHQAPRAWYEDMQKRRNDVKARTTLLLAIPNEHQLRFSNRKGEVHTASVPTASTQVFADITDVPAASLSHDTVCAYIVSQSNCSQIKYEDITQIDENDIEEMDIKWNMALLRMRADRFWKKTGKKITIQGSDVAGFDKSKVEYINCHKMGHFAKECRAPRSQDRGKRESYKQVDDEVPTELALMAKSSSSSKNKVEAILVEFKEQEIKFCEKIRGLERPTPSIDESKCNTSDLQSSNFSVSKHGESSGNPQNNINDKGYWNSGCSRHMTGNISYPSEYEPYDGGYVSFGQGGAKITGKDFKLKDDTNVLLRTPKQHNMYLIYLNNIVPHKNLTCLVAKASVDERKQHKASCQTKLVNSVSKPRHTLHMDLFGSTSVSSLNHKWYCLVVTDDFSRVLVNKSQNKTPYELFNSRTPAIGFLRPFRCHVMILNTLDDLEKFDTKGDECYFVRYSLSSKAFRVFNKRTKKIKENPHVDFLENKLIEKGSSPNWLFDIDTLTNSMNYVPVVVAGTSSTNISGTKDVASQVMNKDLSSLRYIALPNWFHDAHMETRNSDGCNADDPESSGISNPTATLKVPSTEQMEPVVSLTVETEIPTVSSPVPTVCLDISPENASDPRHISKGDFSQKETPSLGNALTLSNRFEDTFEEEADLSKMETSIPVSPTPTFRIHKDHPNSQIFCPVDTPVQTRHKSKEWKNKKEPKKIFNALKDPSWVEAIQEELLQFKIQNVWILVNCPKAPPGFQDLEFPDRVYKVEKVMYGLHQAPRAWYGTLSKEFEALMHDKFQMSAMGELTFFLGLQVLQKKDGIFLSQDKYVGDILKKFRYSDVRSANILIDKENPWGKDGTGKDVELHLYRSMIGSLMYLT